MDVLTSNWYFRSQLLTLSLFIYQLEKQFNASRDHSILFVLLSHWVLRHLWHYDLWFLWVLNVFIALHCKSLAWSCLTIGKDGCMKTLICRWIKIWNENLPLLLAARRKESVHCWTNHVMFASLQRHDQTWIACTCLKLMWHSSSWSSFKVVQWLLGFFCLLVTSYYLGDLDLAFPHVQAWDAIWWLLWC